MSDIFELFRRIAQKGDSPAESVSGPVEWIVAGLGNPGPDYAKTRHNAGFMAVDCMQEKLGFRCDRSKFRALTADTVIGGKRVLVMKPQTFMNLSGESIREAADFYKIPPEKVLVIYDDISLPPGKMRLRRKGTSAGHNGIENIIYQLNSDTFPRIKLGVGSPPAGYDHEGLISWVIGGMPEPDMKLFTERVHDVPDAVEAIVSGDFEAAMGQFNGK